MIISQTPLRISFLGGGTDYPEHFVRRGGAVLGTAVDKFAYLTLSRFCSSLFDYSIRISYRQVECVQTLDEIQHAPVRECLRWAGIKRDVEIHHAAELPAFTGLGSSSSFVVGLLNAIHAYQGRTVEPLDLAYQAIEIEREVLGESVGCQDQTLAAVGGFNLIEFRGREDFLVHPLLWTPRRRTEFEQHLLIFFTGLRRRAEDLAARQVKKIERNRRRLGALRALVDEGYRVLVQPGSLAPFGRLLHRAWLLKRALDVNISNGVVDQMYAESLEAGALGGKLLGAGGGGFLLLFVPPDKQAAVRRRLDAFPEIVLRTTAPASRIVLRGTAAETLQAAFTSPPEKGSRHERTTPRIAAGVDSGGRVGHAPAVRCA